jgi:hypothetical protein
VARIDAGRCVLSVDPNPTTASQSAWWRAAQDARRDAPRALWLILAGHGRVCVKRSEAMRALAYAVAFPEWDACDYPPFTLR